MMRWIFLALLTVTTVLHLADSWNDNGRRKWTKPFLLLFVLLYYVFSVDVYVWPLIAALLTSWLGDVLLMMNGDRWFVMGGTSFMAAHFLFIAVYVQRVVFQNVLWAVVIPAAIVYYGISALIIRALTKTTPKVMLASMYIYLLANSTMNVFSLMQLLETRSVGAVVAFIGAILFFASDCVLFLVRYHKNKDLIFKKHFTVMLTYVVGEFMITQGMLMLQK